MNPKHTWFWLLLALGLLGLILFLKPHATRTPPGPPRILPNLRATTVTSVLVRNSGPVQLGIRAQRTNQMWELTEPVSYPAESTNIEYLLGALERLTAATYISPAEYRGRSMADEEYGFASPQASLTLWQGGERTQILFGARTVPGDQVFLEVVSGEGAYVVDADILKLIPRSADDWRDTAVLNLESLVFDRIAVTNNGKAFVLQREGPARPWRIVSPSPARANNPRIAEALEKLQALRVQGFLAEDSRIEGEALGLAPAELELSFAQGTNPVALLQFGKSPTNNTGLVYGQRSGQKTIFTVPGEPLALWKLSLNDFRDPHLLALTTPVQHIAVHGQDALLLQRQTDETWHIQPQDFPVDSTVVDELVSALTNINIIQFTKDAVTLPDLPAYGLGSPVLEYVLYPAPSEEAVPGTNGLALAFGVSTNQPDKVYVRRADESSIYAISSNDFARLPKSSWQFHERRLWHISESNIAGVTLRQQGRERKLVRRGPGEWSLAPGSSGIINPLAVEATVTGLAQVSAVWVARGEENRARYGITESCRQITIELKNGAKATIEFGAQAPSTDRYAAVALDGQVWILECPWNLYRDIELYLSVP